MDFRADGNGFCFGCLCGLGVVCLGYLSKAPPALEQRRGEQNEDDINHICRLVAEPHTLNKFEISTASSTGATSARLSQHYPSRPWVHSLGSTRKLPHVVSRHLVHTEHRKHASIPKDRDLCSTRPLIHDTSSEFQPFQLPSFMKQMNSGAILRVDIRLYIGRIVWALPESLHRMHVLQAYQKHWPKLI